MSKWQSIVTPSQCLTKHQLLGYIHQTLERDEVYAIESHLNDCPFCNDALEGLMEANSAITEQHLTELENDFLQKLHAQKIDNTPKETPVTEITKPAFTFNRTARWLAAASVLFIVATGAYSVFSYISEQKKELAINDASKNSTQDVPYVEPKTSPTQEITHVEINADSLQPQPIAVAEEAPHSTTATPSATIQQMKDEDKKQLPTKNPEPSTFKPAPIAAAPTRELKDAALAKNESVAEVAVQTDNSNYENYKESEKQPVEEKIVLSKKTKAGGLSKSKEMNNAVAPASNQLNYSSAPSQNNAARTEDYALEQSASKQNKSTSDYEKGLKLYQRGKYSKCIPLLEASLSGSNSAQTEDIYYYLAQAYFQTGNYSKSEEYIQKLSTGAKYKAAAQEIQKQLLETRSKKK
ncbi:MAG TPA: hypothetical protein PLU10_04740 [Chitinophagaceae bacterium]|nr:hypothetical protein [Chitinophagaceae bacterium]